jgi:hypothetical protein
MLYYGGRNLQASGTDNWTQIQTIWSGSLLPQSRIILRANVNGMFLEKNELLLLDPADPKLRLSVAGGPGFDQMYMGYSGYFVINELAKP